MTTAYILLLIALGYLATDIYLPSLPFMGVFFSASESQVQLTLFFYLLSFSCAPMIFGPLSDYLGRRHVIRFGLALSFFATVLTVISPTIQIMMALRFIQGIGTGAVLIATRSMIVDLFSGKDLAKQISNITMLIPLILGTAPLLGGLLQEWSGWQASFVWLAVYIFLVFLLSFKFTESVKTRNKKSIREVIADGKELLANKEFVLFSLGLVLPSMGIFAYLATSPFIFQQGLGLSASQYGMLALYTGGVIMFASFMNTRLIGIISVNGLLFIGVGCILFAGLLMLALYLNGIFTVWSVFVPVLIYFVSLPLCNSNSISKAMSKITHSYGLANALTTSFQFMFGALGSVLFTLFSDQSPLPLALFFIFLGVVTGGALIIACRLESNCKKSIF